MANCPDCGSPITTALTTRGERVPLETFTDTTGDRRYRVVKFEPGENRAHLLVEPVPPQSTIPAYPDHRKDCPAHDNGLRR